MTTHLRVTRTIKGYPEGHPQASVSKAACQGWRSRSDVHTTDVQADVDCKRCANWGGFAPKAKAPAVSPGGTCQICFRIFRQGSGETPKTAKHGFERPGDGFLHGECPGQKHLPFEKSCEETRKYQKLLITERETQLRYAQELRAGQHETLTLVVETTERNPDYKGYVPLEKRYLTRTLLVKKGDPARHGVEGLRNSVPSYDQLVEKRANDAQYRAKRLGDHAAELDKRIASWQVRELLP